MSSNVDQKSEIEELVQRLLEDPSSEPIGSEIGVLQSIYGDDAVKIWSSQSTKGSGDPSSPLDANVRYELTVDLPPPNEDPEVRLRILVTLPPTYPESSFPQLQLLSRYIGAFSVDSVLFGSILRTYISKGGVEWTEGEVCVFDGIESVRERCAKWYADRLNEEKAGELLREDLKEKKESNIPPQREVESKQEEGQDVADKLTVAPEGLELFVAEPILDRKSSFVGRACRIENPSQVPEILSHLMSDRRIARAAHPIINAWRCTVNGVLHQDNDDDGETAAGGRLAHLLQILEVDHVLIIVTRYFGGIHLGPDRFKHINQAARNALELGGFLDVPEEKKNTGRHKKKG